MSKRISRHNLKRLISRISIISMIIILLISTNTYAIDKASENINTDTMTKIERIEDLIEAQIKAAKIPGLSVVITSGENTVYEKSFGYANVKDNVPVTSDTLFELGSTSKAFTALAVLKLESEGLVNLNDPVSKYIPWFKMKYIGDLNGEKFDGYVNITLEQLLHHTSGIPFKTIGDIPPLDGEDALLETIKAINGLELEYYPGKEHEYVTINYDILGLIIQNVTNMSFEEYVSKNVLLPLGLSNTYIERKENMAKGYKLAYLRPVEYNAPYYRGNAPAGYFVSNLHDITRWMNIQLGQIIPEDFDVELIKKSHIPDRSVAPSSSGTSYAAGWAVYQSGGGLFAHSGNNPNFSSFFTFRPEEQIGVALLTNINTQYAISIGESIMNIMMGQKVNEPDKDMYMNIDNFSVSVIWICIPLILATIVFLILLFIQVLKKKRSLEATFKKSLVTFVFISLFILGIIYCLYNVPNVLFYKLPWSFVKVWAPESLITSLTLLIVSIILFCIYYYFTVLFSKSDDKSIFPVSVLSIMSGLGNAMIIFILNIAITRIDEFEITLLAYFIMGIVLYVYGLKIVRARLINLTNDIVYSKRIQIIDRLLNSSYLKFETYEKEKIFAGLNNDTEVISNIANILVSGLTSFVTLACCFIYLGIINFYGLLLSILIIFIAVGLYYIIGKKAGKYWEETRDTQNVFFKFINDLVGGFKELSINRQKRNSFSEDMKSSCQTYKTKRIQGDMRFANVNVIGELLFTFVIGAVVFIFPRVFPNIQESSIRSYVFVFLYMTGPIHGILNAIPNIVQVNISWKRIKELENNFKTSKGIESESSDYLKQNEIELRNVVFKYENKAGESFSVGPISYKFKSGEITFITGGNGSGKTTLAKLITGLYEPHAGEIYINGNKADSSEINNVFSTIFSDYYLFNKLYGIDTNNKEELINEYLKILHIKDKVQINNGVFSTTELSTGQRKRLALLISYLEDKPVILFDEWAADQDPEYRRFFYYTLLPELKQKGKCVLAITHDDAYFNIADNLIKMEMGQLVVR